MWDQADEEGELEELEVPGVPEPLDLDCLFECDVSWTVSLVRAAISVIASRTDEDPERILEAATEDTRLEIIRKKHRAEEMERDLERMSRERLLPDEKTLEKVGRYEAHLCRQLYKAMHELEALQARRQGGAAPLARLDVEGLPEG